jgi:hypothetical protein
LHPSSSSLSLQVAETGTELTNQLRHDATIEDDDWVRAPTDEKGLVDQAGAPPLQDAAPQPDLEDRFFRRPFEPSLKKLPAAHEEEDTCKLPAARSANSVNLSPVYLSPKATAAPDQSALRPTAAPDQSAVQPDSRHLQPDSRHLQHLQPDSRHLPNPRRNPRLPRHLRTPPDPLAPTTSDTADLFLAFEDYARPSPNAGMVLCVDTHVSSSSYDTHVSSCSPNAGMVLCGMVWCFVLLMCC